MRQNFVDLRRLVGITACADRRSGVVRGAPYRVQVELCHRQHCRRRTARPLRIRIAEKLSQSLRNDLPGKAVAVLEPPALALLTTGGELGPVLVDLFLGVATDLERDRLG